MKGQCMRVGIVGYGVVGQATARLFKSAATYDPPKGYADPSVVARCRVVFVCVPTSTLPDGRCDLSLLYGAIGDIAGHLNKDQVVAVRSTVPPGTTRQLQEAFAQAHFAANPEFLRAHRATEDSLQPSRVVIGADSAYSRQTLLDIYRSRLGERVPYVLTDSVTAEFIKYAANCFLATKVLYGRPIRKAAQRLGVDYEDVVRALALDPRIGGGEEWWLEGLRDECLPKDLTAFVSLLRRWRTERRLLETLLEIENGGLARERALSAGGPRVRGS